MALKPYIVILLLSLFQPSRAQEKKDDAKDKIPAMRVAFISQKLNLTSQEAQAFWPLYNEYQQKRDDLRKELIQSRKNLKQSIDEMTDKEAEAFIEAEITYKQKDLDLQKDFHKKLKAILPARKIALLYRAEQQFAKLLLEGAVQETPNKKKKQP